MATTSALASGTDFLGYRVEEPVGRAGAFVVHRAEDVRLRRYVALALSDPGLAEEDASRERFLRDAEVVAALEHPNVVPIYDAGESEGRLYLAMRYVAGTSLADMVDGDDPPSTDRTLEIAEHVGHALDAAHASGLVHGHLTAASVLLDPTGHPYVTGFGLDLGQPAEQAADIAAFAQVARDCVVRTTGDASAVPFDALAAAQSCGDVVLRARSALAARRRAKRRRRALVAALAVGGAVVAAAVLARDVPTERAPPGPVITQNTLLGLPVGLTRGDYAERFGDWLANPLPAGDYAGMRFLAEDVGAYFPPGSTRATVLTTWNPAHRTAAGIGPCSTIAAMKRAYGDQVQPTWAGTQIHEGKRFVYSWAVGNNLLFATDSVPYIQAVALYRGDPSHRRSGSPQAWANWVVIDEADCVPGQK